MYEISKRFKFSASHVLAGLPEGHQCARLHGHNYVVEVVLQAWTLDNVGFVRDYGELAPLRAFIDQEWDHRHLNDVLPSTLNPTAENLARYLYELFSARWPELVAIRISETPDSWAEYRQRAKGWG